MVGMVANYADGVAQALVGKLGQLLSDEYRLLSSVRGEIRHLRDDVAIMNTLLRMLSEADDGAVDHFVREWMKQVRELAYDAEDCIDTFVLHISCVPRSLRVLGGARHLIVTLPERRRLAANIEALRGRALAIGERRVRYGVDGQALRPSISFGSAAAASSTQVVGGYANDPFQLVGIKEQVDSLAEKVKSEKMTSDNQPDKKLKVFSIVGFGGLGKTTLAVEVCRKLEEAFTCQAIVSVSQAFDARKDMRGLLQRILRQVTVKSGNKQKDIDGNLEEKELATMLTERLAEKRYLIVIDDIWTISAWNTIKSKFLENNNGSRIIVTTRIENVAKACSPARTLGDYIHRVKPLELEDSKTLFTHRVFGYNKTCPKELESAMNKILKKCGGLPLAIVSIASLLATYRSPESSEIWKRVCRSIGSQMENNPTLEVMRQLITLSYNHLPHHLKACMMYLSVFPEDYEIDKNRLVNRWIAEGLVPQNRGLTSQEVAEAYFDELLSMNMVKPGKDFHDRIVRTCRVHDIMLEVIVSKSLEANFVSLVGGPSTGTSYDAVRRLSIQGDLGPDVKMMSMRHVRSLSTFHPKGQRQLLDRLPEFTLLRVLDLEGCKDLQNYHMKHVCLLFLLKFLSLVHTDVTEMPSQIGALQHLQTLWLHDSLLKQVPKSLINLEKLEYLSFSNRNDAGIRMRLPRGLHKMKALIELRLELCERDAELAKEISDLVELRQLHIDLDCTNCCYMPILEELAISISKLCSLRELGLEDKSPSNGNNMQFLHNLRSPPQLLRYLNIRGKIDRLPSWLESLTHLVHIELCSIYLQGDEIYGVLYKLPNLLRITFCERCCRDRQLVARTTFKFPVLKELNFYRDNEPLDIKFEEGAMENLERLRVCFYGNNRSLHGVENLISLKEVQLIGTEDDSSALHMAEDLLKTERQGRPESEQFNVLVKYE